jgi:hypothetical protein
MKIWLKSGLVLKAVAFSSLLNLCLVLTAFCGVSGGSCSTVVRIADAIAAPPGVIAQLVLSPKQHTAHAFAVAAAESLVWSFVFYALVAWVALEFLRRWQAYRNRRRSQIESDGGPCL